MSSHVDGRPRNVMPIGPDRNGPSPRGWVNSTVHVICLSLSFTDTHTLRYCYTGVSEPGSGLPEFTGIAYVDDQQIMLFSSDTGRTIPVAQWMKENEGPEVWEHETRIGKEHEALFKSELQLWKKIFNYTEGFHFLKISVSCELRDDGSTKGCWQMRYDEKEYIYLDILNTLFIPTMADAHLVTERWNSPDVKMGEITKIYLETECIPKLKRFAEHGREVLERRGDVTAHYKRRQRPRSGGKNVKAPFILP
ncbi:unnamed protein product [Ranitomeya imitator]|uniref:MHC class I-like antigen recognition-like domain-containing protein n=1 Tax=Ranitomeya imitator TaxID=111125 RepID=A0ABN9LUQ6_9NEOB|nr:unnamed protein product [Ranitomeya imitator]